MNNLLVLILSKSFIGFGIFLAIAYSGACVYLFVAQGKFIFFPTQAISSTPKDFQLKYQDVVLPISSKTGAAESVHGWWIPTSDTPPSPPLARGGVRKSVPLNNDKPVSPSPVPPLHKEGSTPVPPLYKGGLGGVVLYLHGNGLNVGANVEHANRFHRLGMSVFLIDYRGYGKSQGEFPTESQVYEDAQLAMDYLVKQRGINPKQIYIYGHSLGGAIAIDLAVRNPEAAGLIVEGSFTSAREMVDFQSGVYRIFPIDLLLRQRFDSIAKVDRLEMPVLFIHGTADTVVPVAMSKKLFDAAPQPKQLYIVPDAGHNNLADFAGAEYLEKISNFFQQGNTIKH
ncbi:MAG: alpha/beta fold hydrolase [Oscillatoriales cyanobacterium]|uniref:Alpha/beta fold hydrolase n=1 Tax=Microcoleus anatoxicus PTRS2 TaxID=2705321 RepID=A0ABU8YM05_9CYAN|nr:MAG: alpha/beta fold hydrolase [Oscillatoriales cyanobacterium]TAF03671.1 MAG: alpha/beta fold hydrolase [Oscillatoriales cyanobacterium]TAF63291.1 MAG: alpha/beta fold hydrolase [Oscillatoriales cyanobacterium]